MAESNENSESDFVEGTTLSPEDIHTQTGIPVAEATFYQDSIRIYPKGATIFSEGDQEKAMYLLRVGAVEVCKGTGDSRKVVGTIEAVNIFGEMSMINDQARIAAVVAAADKTVVYRIATPNIHTILTNPMWAELLITRLCRNLAECVEQNAALNEELTKLRAKG